MHPFLISKFEPVWIIQENIKPCGPTRQPHGPNNIAAVPTTFGPRPLPCPARRPAHRFCRPRPPPRASFKRSAPPRELPFSSSAHYRHGAVMPPSLSRHETPPQSPFELSVTAPSSTSTLGAPPTSLLVPSAAPPLHHRCSSPTEPSHHGQPAPAILQPSWPHPKHRAAEYILPNRSDPTGDPYSSLPPSLPHHRSPPP
jgi:hypothetical protein